MPWGNCSLSPGREECSYDNRAGDSVSEGLE